jgi:hypothetical protein
LIGLPVSTPIMRAWKVIFDRDCNPTALWIGIVIGSHESALADERLDVGRRKPINNGAALFPMTMADAFAARGIEETPGGGERVQGSGTII